MLDLSLLDLKCGDCLNHLRDIPTESVDLVITSPPYADRRKENYNSISEDEYICWFVPVAYEIRRILSPTGSFFLNIKAHCSHGERQLYVFDLILTLKRVVKFRFIDEYVWYKSAAPRQKTYRLKDAWEPIFHFGAGKNKSVNPLINHEAIVIPSKSTFHNKCGCSSFNTTTGNIGGYHNIADQGIGFTDPPNILYYPTSLLVKDGAYEHPAKFPLEMIEFFVKGFSPMQGTVCDPFVGSGTTALASLINNRKCIAIDMEQSYCEMTECRIKEYAPITYHKHESKENDIFGVYV